MHSDSTSPVDNDREKTLQQTYHSLTKRRHLTSIVRNPLRPITACLLAGMILSLAFLTLGVPKAGASGIVVTKFAPAQVKAGDPLTYTIRVMNTSSFNINVNITDPIPSNVTVADPGSGTVAGGNIQWTSLPVDPFTAVDVTFAVVATRTGDLVNADYYVVSGATTEFGAPITTTILPNAPALITIDADPDSTPVNGSSTLSIDVTDAYGNPVDDDTPVSLNFDRGSIDGQPAGTTVDGVTTGGQLVKTFVAGTVAGTAHLTATAESAQANAAVTIDPGPPASLAVAAWPTSISTVGGETAAITATVTDAYGNPVLQTPVTFTTSRGTLNGLGPTVTMNTSGGSATAFLAGTIAGQAKLTVTTGSLVDTSQSVNLTAGPPAQLSLQANPTAIVADGVTTSTVTLLIRDQYGNLVESPTPVTITTSLGTFPGSSTSYTETNSDGTVQIPLQSGTTTGLATVQAFVAGLSTDTSLNFVAGPPARITLEIDPTTIVADGSSTAVLTVSVYDAFDHRVDSPAAVTFAAAQGTILGGSTGWTNNGVVERNLQSSTTLATVPVTATVAGVITPAMGTVEFVAGPPDSAVIHLNPPSPITAGVSALMTVSVYDNIGHAIPGLPLTVTTSLGTVSPAVTGVTDSNGQIQRTLRSTQAGPASVNVAEPGGPLSVTGGSISFVPDAPAQATLSASPTELVADGITTATISAVLSDRYGNPVPGIVPNFGTTLGTLSGSGPTDATGTAIRSLRSSTSLGTATVSVSGLTTVTTAAVDFIAGPPASASYTANPATAGVGQNVSLVLTVTDSLGHPLVGRMLAVTSTLGTVSGCTTTDAFGTMSCTLNSTRSGQPQLYVAGLLAAGNPITFNPGPLHHIRVTPFGSIANPVFLSAEIPLTFNAEGQDIYNNPVSISNVEWSKTGLGGNGTINATTGKFTGTTGGLVRVKASASGKTGVSYVEVGPGTAAIGSVSAAPLTVPADGTSISNLAITVTDAYGNLVGAGVPVTITASIGTVEGTNSTNSSSLVNRTIRSTQAGPANIGSSNLLTLTGDTVITFTPGTPVKATISGSPTILPANGTAQATISITLLDSFNNPVGAGYAPTVQTSLGSLTGTGVTNSNGILTRTLTAPAVVGTASFTVLLGATPLTVAGDTVDFIVGPLARVEVAPGGSLSLPAGQPALFTAQAYDADDAPIPGGITYGWELICGAGCGQLNTLFGQQVTFTGEVVGSGVELIASADENGAFYDTTLNLTVLPGAPVAAGVTVEPTFVTADGASPMTLTLTNLVDTYGNAPLDGTVVTLTVQSQPVSRTAKALVAGGQAQAVITSTIQAGTYAVTASSEGGAMALTGDTTVMFVPGPPNQAEVTSITPAQIVADGSSTTDVTLRVSDVFGNKVAGGLPLVVTTTLGTILPGGAPTDSEGMLVRTVQAGLEVGEAQLFVEGFAASGPTLSLTPGPPATATVTVFTPTLTAGGASTPVIFDVADAWGHPVADGTVLTPTLSPAYGAFSGPNHSTGGLITQTLTSATTVGTATITSTGISLAGDTLITVMPGPAAVARISANPALPSVGSTSALLVAVTDAYSNVVPPTAITLTAVLGTFDGGGATVTKSTASGTGTISTTLFSTTAGTETLGLEGPAGPLTIHPTSDSITFLPGPPLNVTIDPTGPLTLAAGMPITLTTSSRDAYGNAVDPWTPVDYTWYQAAAAGGPGYGSLTPLDARGRSVEFMPNQIGTNQLWTSGGITDSSIVALNVIAGPPATATIAVSPDSVPAGDTANAYTVTLTSIADAFGNPLPDGTPLTITVQSVPSIVGSGTTTTGAVTVTLPANTFAGPHAIVVEGTGGPLTLTGDAVVTFTPGPAVQAVVDAVPETVPGDGTSTAALVVTIYDSYLNPVAAGTPITVTTSLGTISGSGTTINGQVMRTLHAPVNLGTALFSVEAPSGPLVVSGDTVEFLPGSPVYAALSATPAKLFADGTSTSQLIITVKDGSGFSVDTSKTAVLTVTRGALVPTTTVASAGTVTATFTAGNSVGPAGLAVTYDGALLQVVGDALELISGDAVSATISANPTTLTAGSDQQSTLTVNLFDSWHNPVADGTVVTVTTSVGNIMPDNNTTVNGTITRILSPGLTVGTATFSVEAAPSPGPLSVSGDTVDIVPGELDHIVISPTTPVQVTAGKSVVFSATGYDAANNEIGAGTFNWKLWLGSGQGTLSNSGVFTGTIAGTVGVQASQGNIFSPIKTVTIVPGLPVTATLTANPLSIPAGGATSRLTITARDAYGNLVTDGTSLNVTANLGTLVGTGTTNNGVLTRTLVSDAYYGAVDIIVNGWKPSGDKPIITPGVQVTANPSSLYADGQSTSVLTIAIFNTQGQPVPDGTVPSVTSTLGTLTGSGGTVNGVLTRTLRASLTPGVAQIYVDGVLGLGDIPFIVGPATTAHIKANPPVLLADGQSQSQLTLTVKDDFGHIITAAGPLSVSASTGTLSGAAPTINGITTRQLTSDSSGGTAIISVAGLAVAGDWKIHFAGSNLNDTDFESGNLNNWTVGSILTTTGASLAYSATVLSSAQIGQITVTPFSGQQMVRLGATTTDNAGHGVGEVWLRQPAYVPAGGITQITFWYRLLSYDVSVGSVAHGNLEWDPFEVYLNGQEVLQDGFPWSPEWQEWHGPPLPPSPQDMGWKQGVLDLTPYAGQIVTLEFRVPNRQAAIDNTWVFVDGLNMIYRDTVTYKIFLPTVIR